MSKYLTILTVLRDGSHVIYQTTENMPGQAGVRIGAHIALRREHYGEDLATVVVVHGATVTEHQP